MYHYSDYLGLLSLYVPPIFHTQLPHNFPLTSPNGSLVFLVPLRQVYQVASREATLNFSPWL